MATQALYHTAATVVVALHALWIVWVVGGLLVVRMSRPLRRVHLACAFATLVIMAARGYCPLTDLEVYLQQLAGQTGYEGGFIQHYASAFVYGELIAVTPAGLMVGTMLITAIAIVLHGGKYGIHEL